MKRHERAVRYRVLAAWRTVLSNANDLAVTLDDPDVLAALLRIRDYIIGQIEQCERSLIAGRHASKVAPKNAQFATLENRRDNPSGMRS